MRTFVYAAMVVACLAGAAAPGASAQPASTPAPTAADTMTATPAPAPAPTPAATPAPKPQTPPLKERIYYGGSVALSFGNVDRIGIYPMIGYKLTPKVSLGGEIGYEYLSYDTPNVSTSNYGGAVFARYSILPQLYARGKFALISYEAVSGGSDRTSVPYLLLGGGVVQRLNPRTSAYAEVLFDALQDDNSPYDSWEPFVSIGVGVGF